MLYKEYELTWFNHPKNASQVEKYVVENTPRPRQLRKDVHGKGVWGSMGQGLVSLGFRIVGFRVEG